MSTGDSINGVDNGKIDDPDDIGGSGGDSSGMTPGGKVVDVGKGTTTCEPKTCEDEDAQCGTIADGCGKVVDCGECADGEECGIVERNVCTDLDSLCEPIAKDEACDGKECGLEGDGCGDFHDCGSCEDGEVCGAEEPFVCSAGGSNPGMCVPITSCEDAGRRCGVIGDGCGGTIDCNAELGPCEDGTYCGIVTPYQCDEPVVDCTPSTSCAALGWECGVAVDDCGNTFDCMAESRSCGALEQCVGGINAPTQCQVPPALGDCELCPAVPSCPTGITRITGRVITPGRDAGNTANQVGVPNAFVYIVRNNDLADLPPVPTGIAANGTSCDRCDEQEFGPILAATSSNAEGEWEIAGNVPVGAEFLLVTKVGRFRRAERVTVPSAGACTTTNLSTAASDNPTRLPRHSDDGLAVNIPHIAVTTGQIDAMECVFEKIGIAHDEFGNHPSDARIHLYRGGGSGSPSGAWVGDSAASTPHDAAIYGSLDRLREYDMIVADCEGQSYTSNPNDTQSANLRGFVNRGGRLFASHLSFVWLNDDAGGTYPTGQADFSTGLQSAATWNTSVDASSNTGNGMVSEGRPQDSPRIANFTEWMIRENVIANATATFSINEPRSQVANGAGNQLGQHSEEFVHTDSPNRTQQFSFNTPYGAPEDAICGRVAYSGFHVSYGGGSSPYGNVEFPEHCDTNSGNLSDQEKVLLYMLFDLGACVGEIPEIPQCNPVTCAAGRCGVIPNGCGGTIDCGSCIPECVPTTCEAQNSECGNIGDGCSNVLDCGDCPPGQTCGADGPNMCGDGPDCEPQSCDDTDAECGLVGDGCGDINDCGECPPGQICGLEEPYKCGTPECEPISCEDASAECGEISDGCGDSLDCGDCDTGQTCGQPWANRCSGIE